MPRLVVALLSSTFLMPMGVQAQSGLELSFYLGVQESPHSRIRGSDNTGAFNFLSTWEGRSGEAPPYYGLRATWWRTANFGFGAELNHAKVYADNPTLIANGFNNLEFTDGLNIITANAFYRWPGLWANERLTPYVGGGVGIAVPHVDVERGGQKTFEYQYTGPAVMWAAGLSYDINDTWAVFTEYKGTFSQNEAELTGGGTLSTDIVTTAVNFGLTYKF